MGRIRIRGRIQLGKMTLILFLDLFMQQNRHLQHFMMKEKSVNKKCNDFPHVKKTPVESM
jgi:hypothetical protein